MRAKGEVISKISGFLVSIPLFSNLSELFKVESCGSRQLKGKTVEIEVFSIPVGQKV
jgi:hypothetical protein